MISSIVLVASALLLLVLLGVGVALASRRRGRSPGYFELGAVSQQWLVGHKGDER